MQLTDLQARAVAVRATFAEYEHTTYGRSWTTADLVNGLMTDVGDLAAAVQRVEGIRPARDVEPLDELRHELADCLWVLLVLADRFDVELSSAFEETMAGIERTISGDLRQPRA